MNRIFHAALEVDPGERSALVSSEASGDTDIAEEVERLLRADADAGTYLDSFPQAHELFAGQAPPLLAGDVLCGRFRVVREIGEGGMGQVFEAFDLDLSVPVALKIIRPEIAFDPSAVGRFRQEVRLARSVTHPNICRTFDLERDVRGSGDRQTELLFLTMEFLPGESLAARLRRTGALSLAESLAIARQIAAALDAAHALGVVHRDMKPANVMLVPRNGPEETPRAVVTDFGLARMDRVTQPGVLSSFTQGGHPVGTLAYMAPEQLEGTATTAASDLYAFGLLLYEMVTGRRAFPSDSLLAGVAQRLQGSPALARSLPRHVPAAWRDVLAAALRMDPADRPKSAVAMVSQLEKSQPRSLPRLRFYGGSPKRGLPWIVAAGILLCAVALFFAASRLYRMNASSQVAPGALVYLVAVKNQTGEHSLDALTELIRGSLSQSKQVNLLDPGRAGDILQQMTKSPGEPIDAASAREVAMRSGAVRVILPAVARVAQGYRLTVEVQQPDYTPARLRGNAVQSWTWPSAGGDVSTASPELLGVIRKASEWVRARLGESAADIARMDAPPEDVTTANWQALAAFADAERFNLQRRREDALSALGEAVRLDPKFALAYARMGDLLNSVDRTAEGDEAYLKALSADAEYRLTRRERDRIRGIYALDTWDYATAEAVFRDFTIYYEDDYLGWFYRGAALVMLDRAPEAAQAFARASSLRPASASAALALGSVSLMLGDRAAAHQSLQHLRQQHNEEEATLLAAHEDFLDGRFDQAGNKYGSLQQAKDVLFRSRSYSWLAGMQAERGDRAAASATLTRGMEVDEAAGNHAEHAQKRVARASVECQVAQYDACLADALEASKEDGSAMMLGSAADVLSAALDQAPPAARLALLSGLTALRAQLPSQDLGMLGQVVRLQVQGEVLLAEHRLDEAVAALQKAAVLAAPAEPQDALARALLQAAAHQPGAARSAAMKQEARDFYGRSALQPAYVLYRSSFYPPGQYANALRSWLTLAVDTGPAEEWSTPLHQYAALRPEQLSQDAALQSALSRLSNRATGPSQLPH